MPRKKNIKLVHEACEITKQASKELAAELASAFDEFTIDRFGMLNPPNPYLTPTGIKPLDALLGGGLASSMPIAFSSTPETGKSTIAFQFAKQFLNFHENGLVVYFDIESTAAELEIGDNVTVFQETRAETFELVDDPRFRYNRRPFTIKEFFTYLDGLVQKKREIQQRTGSEIKVLFIVDSITALSYSRLDSVEDFDKIPGKRAGELSFYLNKWKQNFAYDRISMITIDQLKAAMSLKSQYEQMDEKSVGTWRNTKAATGIYTYQHMVAQWLFFSKKQEINPAKFPGWGIDGWVINIITEKNKNVTSQHEISIVFDKRNGIDKFWSEFLFLSDYTPSEKQILRDSNAEPFLPLAIKTEGAFSKLEIINPLTGEVEYTSKGFYKKNAKKMYNEDEEFHKWFDIAVDYSCRERISKGLLKIDMNKMQNQMNNCGENEMEELNLVDNQDQDNNLLPKKRGRKKKNINTEEPIADSTIEQQNQNLQILMEEN